MPDIAGVLNTEVRLPLTEGPGFLKSAFVELEDEGTVAIGVLNERGYVYAYARIDEAQFWRIADSLFPGGRRRPTDNAEIRRNGH